MQTDDQKPDTSGVGSKDLLGFRLGDAVMFHPIIGGKHDGRKYIIRALGECSTRPVAWLKGKSGCVAIEALSKPPPGFGLVDPLAP